MEVTVNIHSFSNFGDIAFLLNVNVAEKLKSKLFRSKKCFSCFLEHFCLFNVNVADIVSGIISTQVKLT